MVYAGQADCYGNCSETIRKLCGVEVGATQIYRVTGFYGKAIGDTVNAGRTLSPLKQDEVLYVEVDGSMLLTREEGWKEVKVGRIFKSSDCIHAGKRGWVSNSQYVAHLGNCTGFTGIMESIIESYGRLGKRLIFISDGALWIKNWVEDAFPDAVSMLDYYHACEHLHLFSNAFFKNKELGGQWTGRQKELLSQGDVSEVVKNIRAIAPGNKEAERLLCYYEGNALRMAYQKYKKVGCGIIGSGAIESAHRTVVQKRMKLSGQRWGRQGAQQLLNLRVINKNQQWAKIIELSKNEIKKAA